MLTKLLRVVLTLAVAFASPATAKPFALRFLHRGAQVNSITYDQRWGTSTDANGLITFGLNSGNRNVYLNCSRPDDSGDGLSNAAAEKTWDAAFADLIAGSPGDHLLVAQGCTFTDSGSPTGSGSWTFFGYGTTALAFTYPTTVQSYDPADAANTAKYGRATGGNMPILNIPTNGNTPSLTVFGNSGTHGYAIQGIELAGNYGISFNGTHTVVVQNTRWNVATLAINANSTSAASISVGVDVSKSTFWGAWATSGNNSGLFIAGINTPYLQGIATAHSGWKVGAARSDDPTVGGANVFGHGIYYYPNNLNGHIDRFIGIDAAADSLNVRGGAAITQFVALDEPIAATIGGSSSGDYTDEAPNGVLITADDGLVMGGADINNTNPRGLAFSVKNTIAGSRIRNVGLLDNPNSGGSVNFYLGGGNDNASLSPGHSNTGAQALLLAQLHGYNYSPTLVTSAFTTTYPVAITWTNDVIDDAITGVAMVDGGGNSVATGATFTGYKTRDQIITAALTAMGITPGSSYSARKAQLVNLILWRPDMVDTISQLLLSIGLPAMGLTPLYATASAPNLSAESPRAVY